MIPPLRHPLLIAKELATLDLLSQGRLVVQPTVSWHRAEYEALGVPFETRGQRLDEHLAAWEVLWRAVAGDVPRRPLRVRRGLARAEAVPRPTDLASGSAGSACTTACCGASSRYGHGFNPLGRASDDDLARLAAAMAEAGRDIADLEMVGGTRGAFPDASHPAPLDQALDQIPEQVARGFGTICIKPSQFTDDPARGARPAPAHRGGRRRSQPPD